VVIFAGQADTMQYYCIFDGYVAMRLPRGLKLKTGDLPNGVLDVSPMAGNLGKAMSHWYMLVLSVF
jgi:hypothetical protein